MNKAIQKSFNEGFKYHNSIIKDLNEQIETFQLSLMSTKDQKLINAYLNKLKSLDKKLTKQLKLKDVLQKQYNNYLYV